MRRGDIFDTRPNPTEGAFPASPVNRTAVLFFSERPYSIGSATKIGMTRSVLSWYA